MFRKDIADGLLALNSLFSKNFSGVACTAVQLLHIVGVLVLLHLLLKDSELVDNLRLTHHDGLGFGTIHGLWVILSLCRNLGLLPHRFF